MTAFRDFSLFAPRYPTLTPEAAGQKTFNNMVENVDTILQIGGAIAQTRDSDEYIELRKAEAYYTTKTFTDLATPEVQQQDGFTEFKWRATGLGISANLGDSILDARKDFRTGKTQLPPSKALYHELLYDTARYGKDHISYVLDKEGVKYVPI